MGRSWCLCKDLAKLQAITFEIADLPDGQLATATSSKITLDEKQPAMAGSSTLLHLTITSLKFRYK